MVVIDRSLHEAGRTYAGANNADQVLADSTDIYGAALLDQKVHLENLSRLSIDSTDLSRAFEQLNTRNQVLFDRLSTQDNIRQYLQERRTK